MYVEKYKTNCRDTGAVGGIFQGKVVLIQTDILQKVERTWGGKITKRFYLFFSLPSHFIKENYSHKKAGSTQGLIQGGGRGSVKLPGPPPPPPFSEILYPPLKVYRPP